MQKAHFLGGLQFGEKGLKLRHLEYVGGWYHKTIL